MKQQLRTGIIAVAVITVVLGLLLFQLGCGGGEPPDAESGQPPLVLRSYQVDPGVAPELASVLAGLLSLGEDVTPYGRVRQGPGGQILVAAPPSFHEGVGQVVEELRAGQVTQPRTVAMSYWVAVGTPAEQVSWPSSLEQVAPALEAVVAADGPTRFQIVEELQLRSLAGERGEARGRHFRVTQSATVRDNGVFARLEIAALKSAARLATTVSLDVGQTLVLGRSGVPERLLEGVDEEQATLFFIIGASAR